MPAKTPSDLEWVADARQAAALLEPLRARILTLTRQPASATELGVQLGLPRQRVNYHVRELSRAGLLRRAGRRRKRNMFEQLYVASSIGYVLSPQLLGSVGADWRAVADVTSAAYLAALTVQMQADLARAVGAAGGKRLATLSIKSQFRFENPEQRERFAREVKDAIVTVVARLTSANLTAQGKPGSGRPYRLVLGCYPYALEAPVASSGEGNE
jgi:DNA-binding transcriptional ArsR family regulator